MTFCPKCNQEYDEGVKECADCMTPLVGEPGKVQEKGDASEEGEAGSQAVVFRASDEKVLDLMCRAVAVHHIPVKTAAEIPDLDLKGYLMLVPLEMSAKVQHILDQGLTMLIGEGEGTDRIYRMYRPGEEEEIRDPELLRASTESLISRGDEILDELIEIVARGDRRSRSRAAYVLSQIGDEGALALVKLLKVAVEKEQEETAVILIRVVRDEFEDGQGWREFLDSLAGSELTKILALQAICAFQSIEAFPAVLPLIDDPSRDVRDEADNVLCTLSDEDMGFDTQAAAEERARVKERWKEWWCKIEARRNG